MYHIVHIHTTIINKACGPATGNDFCMKPNSPPDMFHCIPVGDYSPNYAVDPFSAEVGDWSAKYGSLILDSDYKISRTDSSFYEVNAAEVHGYSVVFHCNSEERAFCAQFVESTEDATLSKPAQTNAKSVLADFSSALDSESIIILYPNGDVFVDLDVTHKYIPDAMCERLRYGVFEPGNMKLSESNLGGACNEYVGAQYDPTHACLANSSSPYCSNGVLCDENNDSNYIYNCSFAQDRYSCAPGDLSGKFGLITDPANTPLSVEYIGRDSLIPPTDSLIGKVMVIQCENAGIDGYNPMHIACAPIEEYGANDGNKGRNVEEIIAFIAIGFGVAMFCAFMCYVVVRVKGYELRKTPNVKGRLIEEESINKSNNEEVVDSMNKRIL